jgi:polyphosphate kinase
MNLAVALNDPRFGERYARIKVPPVFSRLLRIPSEEKADSYENLGLIRESATNLVWLEEVIGANLDLLFPGIEILAQAYHNWSVTEARKGFEAFL